jgi:chromosome segregation ATPase
MLFFVVGAVIGGVVGGIIGFVEHAKRKERHERELAAQRALAAAKANEISQLNTTKTTLQNQVSQGHRVVHEYQATATTLRQRSNQYKADSEALREERDTLERDKNDVAMNEAFNRMSF